MAESWLHGFKDELVRMRRDQRMTLDQIIAFMEQHHQRRMAKSTLSAFFTSLPEMRQPVTADAPRVSPEEQHFMAQAEVLAYVKQTSATLVEAMARLHARQDVLETAAADRQTVLLARVQRVEEALRSLASTRAPVGAPDEVGLQVLFEELRRVTQALDAVRGRLAPPASAPPPFLGPAPVPRRHWRVWRWGLGVLLLGVMGLAALAAYSPPFAAWLARYGSMPWPWLRP